MKKALLFVALCLFQTQIYCSTFHAIVIADTACDDVKNSGLVDIKKMKVALNAISKACRKKLKLTVLQDSHVTGSSVEKWFTNLEVGAGDIVLFYFTGHGFAATNQFTRWPNLFFKTKKEIVAMEMIHNALESKAARLTIVLSDSCNKFANSQIHSAVKVNTSFSAKKGGINRLFNHNKGKILASGAVPGTASFGSDYGGFFTQAFLLALQDESRTSKPNWKRVFAKVHELLKHAQAPQSELHLR